MADKVGDGIKSLLSVKIKPRQDGYCDQFNRILMLKIMLVATVVVGFNWYTDSILCIIPEKLEIDKDFVSSACWINGLYVYEQIRYHKNDLGYFGIPNEFKHDGRFADKTPCSTKASYHKTIPNCIPMEKTFFLQYQYMVFYLMGLGALYYSPYILFRKVNEDIVSLKGSMKNGDSADSIVENYFNAQINPRWRMKLRLLGDVLVKVLYVTVGVVAFQITDSVLSGGFVGFGSSWLSWSKLNNSMAYDYMGKRGFPKPGNELLPSYALCQVHEAAQDIKITVTNKHTFICEISQFVLYQYVFIMLWFAMVFSIIVSVIGLLSLLIEHIITATCFMNGGPYIRAMYDNLEMRECQYLEYIRKKDMPMYKNVLDKLKGEKGVLANKKSDDDMCIPLKDAYKA